MAETLGSLCDKLIISELKKIHTLDELKIHEVQSRIEILKEELNEFVDNAIRGKISKNRLVVKANKVYDESKYPQYNCTLSMAGYISELSRINFELWKEQEKIYEFDSVPDNLKNSVIYKLAKLNLDRNKIIEEIYLLFFTKIEPLLEIN